MKKSGIFSIYLVLLLATACSQLPPISQSVPANNSRYIKNSASEKKKKVIVFVHGVLGNATSSWTNETTKSYWPDLIAKDQAFADADVYVYEYPSPPFDRSLSVNEVADVMRGRLESDKVLSYPEIIFLSHSMGGLVTRNFLLKYREHASKVKMAYFFATPTTGSPMATLAGIVSENPQFPSMYPMKVDSFLADILRDWHDAQLPIRSFCAYEKNKAYGVTIVDFSSASNTCTEPMNPISEDHINIVKPSGTSSDAYIAFLNAYTTSTNNDRVTHKLLIDTQKTSERQNPDTVASLTLTEKALVAANRPWIKVDIQVGGPISYDINGANFTLKYILKNIGHSPATNVMVRPRVIFHALSGTVHEILSPHGEMQKDISNLKTKPTNFRGFTLFPGDEISEVITVMIPQDDIKQATHLFKAIYPTIVGAVDYRMGLDNNSHQTGFVVEIWRNDAPRPEATLKKRAPNVIWVDEGDVPASEIRLFQSYLDGGFAD